MASLKAWTPRLALLFLLAAGTSEAHEVRKSIVVAASVVAPCGVALHATTNGNQAAQTPKVDCTAETPFAVHMRQKNAADMWDAPNAEASVQKTVTTHAPDAPPKILEIEF